MKSRTYVHQMVAMSERGSATNDAVLESHERVSHTHAAPAPNIAERAAGAWLYGRREP